jgi:hypothetical protein
MNAIRNSLAGLSAALFTLTALAALLFFNFERRAFNPNTYKQALADQKIYEQVPAMVGELMVASANYDPCAVNPIVCQAESSSPEAAACFENALGKSNYEAILYDDRAPSEIELQQAQRCLDQFPPAPSQDNGPPPFLANLNVDEWRGLITALLPPADLQGMVDQAFDSVFAVLNGRAETAHLDLTGIKTRLTGPAGLEAVLTLLRAQPPCTLDQVATMTFSAFSLQGNLELCSPTDDMALIVQPLIEFNLQLAVFAIPDRVPLIPRTTNLSGQTSTLETLRYARLAMRLSPLVPLIFLLGLTLLGVRSLITWLRWWGWPILIVGISGALIGFLSAPVLSLILTSILTRRLPAYLPVGIVEIGGQVIDAVVREMLWPVAWVGLFLAIAAGTMVFLARQMAVRRLTASEAETENRPV